MCMPSRFSLSPLTFDVSTTLNKKKKQRAGRGQVWVLFRRYRQFVALRQQLKAECRESTAPRNTPAKRSLTAGVGSGGTHTNHSKSSTEAKMSAARVAGGTMPVPVSSSGEMVGQTASSEAVRAVLAEFKYPSKIAIAGPTALRAERRRSLNAFLQALVSARGRGRKWQRGGFREG